MKNWKYNYVHLNNSQLFDYRWDEIKKMGENGWELVTVDNGIAFLKKEIED